MKNWEIWATQTHCKSKKWKISWTKGQLSLRWLMLIFPPPWKKGPPKALPLINPNDLWQTIPKNVFFFCIHKKHWCRLFQMRILSIIKTKHKVLTDSILQVESGHQVRPPLSYTNWCTENISAASMALPQWHRGVCLSNKPESTKHGGSPFECTCFWKLRQSLVMFWFTWWID